MVAVVAVPLVAAGCGTSGTSSTALDTATRGVAIADVGSLAIRGAELVTSPPPSPTPSPSTTPAVSAPPETAPPPSPGVQGYLVLTIINAGDSLDTLTNATVTDGAVQPSGDTSSLDVAAHQTLAFGDPEIGMPGPALEVGGFSTPPDPGTSVDVTLSFQSAGTVHLTVPVKAPDSAGSTQTAKPVPLSTARRLDSGTPAPGYPSTTPTPSVAPTTGYAGTPG